MAVYNFGSINIDHIYSVEHFVEPGETLSSSHYQQVLGGKGANQSIACARANCQVFHIGSVNKKDIHYLEYLEGTGVNCDLVTQTEETASGHAIIQVTAEGENAIVLYTGANHTLTSAQIQGALEQAYANDWVLLQNETNKIEEIINTAHAKGLKIAFNPAPMTNNIKALDITKIDLLFVNEIEAMQLTQTQNIASARLALTNSYPSTKVVMTMGKAGAVFLHQNESIDVAGKQVDVVDTTAAGDTFTGYFLANYCDTNDVKLALEHATAAAALCVTKSGAAPSIPNAQEVALFINS